MASGDSHTRIVRQLRSGQITIPNRGTIMALAARERLPTLVNIVDDRPWPGAVLRYGPNLSSSPRRAAAQVDRILKGAKPADMPIEQPDKYDFVVDLAVASDVDGDGLVDVVVVVSEALTSSPTTALVLLRGAPSSKMLAAPVTIQTLTGGKSFTRVAAAGDVNGDGYADVLVNEEDSIADTGEVRVRYGGPTGLALGPIVSTFQTPFASRAVELGDLDGDGIGDIAIGSHASIDIVLGSGAGPGSPTSLAACANAILSRTPGDLDGDGIPDLAALSSCGFGVFYGGAKTWSILSKPTGFPSLGSSFAIAGDVDGDGYDDLVSSLGSLAGMLSYGSPTGASDANRVVFSAPHASQGIVAVAGDLDRDGYMDLLLGETENAFNWLYTFVGTPNGPSQETIVSPLDNGAWAEHTIIR